jgi:hypothetical protein
MKLICWIQGLFRSLFRVGFYQDGIPIDGCTYVEQETHYNKTVYISKCEKCGKVDISWS